MKWAARKVQLELEAAGGSFGFGERVEKVDAVVIKDSGDVKILRVTSRQLKTGKEVIRFTKNIILSTGGSPKIPEQFTGAGIEETGRLVHTSAFLYKIPTILSEIVQSRIEHPSRQIRIAVVGGGQSSAECFLHAKSYLNKLLPASLSVRPQIDLFIRKAALRPADDSPFSNEAFDPVMSQTVYDLDNRGRETFMKEIRGTNYSVANPVTLEAVSTIILQSA